MESLKHRSREAEKLDNLALSGPQLEKVLSELSFINRMLGNTRVVLQAVMAEISEQHADHIQITDLGCGGGDLLIALERKLKKKGISYQLLGIDGNAHALDFARKEAGNQSQIVFKQQNILLPNFQLDPCDILISSHFIYHFPENDLLEFIQKHSKTVRMRLFFSELIRSRWAFVLFRMFAWFFRLHEITQKDGQTAIKRAYKVPEIKALLDQAKNLSYRIRKKSLFRMIVSLTSSQNETNT